MKQERYKQRYYLVYFSVFLLFAAIFYRLLSLQVYESGKLKKLADKQHNLVLNIPPKRGSIFDRNGNCLADTMEVPSVYVVPRLITYKEKTAGELSSILSLDKEFVRRKIFSDKVFVWLKRKVSDEEAEKIRELKNPNVNIIMENKRVYPNNEIMSHVIGFCDIDNKGLEGLELAMDKYLSGRSGKICSRRDARGRVLPGIEDHVIPPVHGHDMYLTLDLYIQHIAEKALEKGYEKWKPKGASVVVIDPFTGEILAMANRPTYDNNKYNFSESSERRNRAITDIYEPGSVFKSVTFAGAIEEGVFDFEDKIFCENGEYRPLRGRVLHDAHEYGELDFPTVLIKSSNIGTVKIAQKLGEKKLYEYIKKFGFGEPTGVELPGEAAGIVRPLKLWSKYSITSIPMGQEVAVNNLQIAVAYSAIANGGKLIKPYVVKKIVDKKGVIIKENHTFVKRNVVSSDTASSLIDILVKVVEEGTGKRAQIEGVKVAGKTGTAQKLDPGGKGYSHSKFFSSFVGIVPADCPKLVISVVFDEPRPSYYGGTVAGPVFKEIAEKSLKYMEVKR